MTKADVVNIIANKTGKDKEVVLDVVELFMKSISQSICEGNNVYLRGFGTFLVKKRAFKLGRNINEKTTVQIPAHCIPAFKPAKSFTDKVKKNVKHS